MQRPVGFAVIDQLIVRACFGPRTISAVRDESGRAHAAFGDIAGHLLVAVGTVGLAAGLHPPSSLVTLLKIERHGGYSRFDTVNAGAAKHAAGVTGSMQSRRRGASFCIKSVLLE